MKLYQTSRTIKLKTGVVQSWPMGMGGFSQSVTSYGFYLFEEKRRKWPLILASGHPGASRRWEGGWYGGCCYCCCCCRLETREANLRFSPSKLEIEHLLRPWSNLNEPKWGHYSDSAVRLRLADDMGFWRQMEETGQEIFSWSVWGKDIREKPYTAR